MCQIPDTCTDVPLIQANKEICGKQLEDESLNVIQAVAGMNDAVYEYIYIYKTESLFGLNSHELAKECEQ